MTDRSTVLISRLRAKNLGNPKVAAGFTDEEMGQSKRHWLGVILGKATGVSIKSDPKDETKKFKALTGFFEGRPDDEKRPILRSGICYLPGGVHELICESIETALENGGGVVQFVFHLGTQRDTNDAGYSYVTEELSAPQAADPLQDMRTLLSAPPEPETIPDEPPKRRRR